MAFLPATHARQQPAVRERGQHRHAQTLRSAARGSRRGFHAVVELVQRSLHASQQRLPCRIEQHAASATLEKIEAQLLLQSADLLTDRAMRQVQDLSGGAEILQLRDGAKSGQRVERETCHGCLVSAPYQYGQNKSIPMGTLAR